MFVHISGLKVFHEIVANLTQNATGKVRFLKTLKVRVFFGKTKRFFSRKNFEFFQNRQMWQVFCKLRIKWNFSLKLSLAALIVRFLG